MESNLIENMKLFFKDLFLKVKNICLKICDKLKIFMKRHKEYKQLFYIRKKVKSKRLKKKYDKKIKNYYLKFT